MKSIILFSGILAALTALADSTPQVATYVFPTAPDLASVASFALPDFTYSLNAGLIQISYDLPSDLVGPNPIQVVLSGSSQANPILLSGPLADANCTTSSASLSCNVTYKNLPLNEDLISQYLGQTISNPTELSQRRNVAMLFGGEPIGTVLYNYYQ